MVRGSRESRSRPRRELRRVRSCAAWGTGASLWGLEGGLLEERLYLPLFQLPPQCNCVFGDANGLARSQVGVGYQSWLGGTH